MRESLVEVMERSILLRGQNQPHEDEEAIIQRQYQQVDILSITILKSFPQLLGFTYGDGPSRQSKPAQQGKMAGRLFSLFSVWVIQMAKSTTVVQKQLATEVVAWLNTRHELG